MHCPSASIALCYYVTIFVATNGVHLQSKGNKIIWRSTPAGAYSAFHTPVTGFREGKGWVERSMEGKKKGETRQLI